MEAYVLMNPIRHALGNEKVEKVWWTIILKVKDSHRNKELGAGVEQMAWWSWHTSEEEEKITLVGSRLDYCNSLLAGTSVSNLARLQLVQNTLARVVAQKPRFCHITPVLADPPLASYPSQNKFQNCYHRFQGIAFPAAILSRCLCSTVCAHAITAIFLFLVNMHSLTKNRNGKVQVVLIRCLGHSEWVTISSFIHFRSSCFQEETQASSFFKCFPRYFHSTHWHHALWCHHIHECKSRQMHFAA